MNNLPLFYPGLLPGMALFLFLITFPEEERATERDSVHKVNQQREGDSGALHTKERHSSHLFELYFAVTPAQLGALSRSHGAVHRPSVLSTIL